MKLIRNSFIAGILIGLGCVANILANNSILGPFLFSLGLITVIVQDRTLYTGKIGYFYSNKYIEEYKSISYFILMLLWNLFGIAIMGIFFGGENLVDSSAICISKYSETFYQALVKSVGCGMLMYIAVEGYKRTKQLLCVILPVMMFIICGFDHCIANYGYMALNGDFFCWQLPVWILGNSIGSLIISKI